MTETLIRGRNWKAGLALFHRMRVRYRVWGLFMISQNIGAVLLYVAILKLVGLSNAGTLDLTHQIAIILPGLILFAAMNQCFTDTMAELIYDKNEKVIQDIYLAPLDGHDILLSIVLIETCAVLVFAMPLWPVLLLFDLPPWPARGGMVLIMLFAAVTFFTLLGAFVGFLALRWDHFTLAYTFIFLPFAAISGCFFPISAIPAQVISILQWNPVARVVEGFRAAWLGTTSPFNDVATLLIIALLCFLLYRGAFTIITNRLRLV